MRSSLPPAADVARAVETAPPSVSSCRPATLSAELRISVSRLHRQLRSQRGEADLSDGQYAVLSVLDKFGPMSPGALADHERMRPPSMTRTVNALDELGLVRKSEHPTDGRQVLVSVTEAGVAELRETRRRRDAWLTRRLGALTAEDRAVLARSSELLRRLAAG
ncbi:MarR family protein [mine drainage metagenome]|uniref:MarR family protein n=1 Tax=mine drainage metagenome TaxID=410659 RepID=A0A1J5QRY6_9ZZZZ